MSLKVPYSDFYSNHLSYDGSPCSFEVQIWGQNGSGLSWSFIFPTLERNRIVFTRKALPGFFICIFSSLTCPKKLVFSKRDFLPWKFPARLYRDRLTSGRYQPASHYFQKVKKSQLYFVQEKDLSTGPSMIFDLFCRLRASSTDLKSWKGLYSGSSPKQKLWFLCQQKWNSFRSTVERFVALLYYGQDQPDKASHCSAR